MMTSSNPSVSDDSPESIRVEHRYDEDTPPSIAIVQAIAALENVNPMDFSTGLGVRLYDHVDPEALDQLVTDAGDVTGVTVDLTLHDGHRYAVLIRDTGQLVVQRPI